MSTSIYKVEYSCDCGCDYGNCEAKCAIIIKSHNTTNIYSLFHTDSHRYKRVALEVGNDTPVTTLGGLDVFSDAYNEALIKVLNMTDPNPETLTESEKTAVFK